MNVIPTQQLSGNIIMYIEQAKECDLTRITKIHIACWKEVYDFIPERVHRARSFQYRLDQWSSIYERPKRGSALFVLKNAEGLVVGFCYCKKNDDDAITALSELHAAYVLPDWRGGLSGPLMMRAMVEHLIDEDLQPMCLWAFDNNKIQRWYQMMGWKKVVRRDRVIEGCAIPESGFVCADPGLLAERLNRIIDAPCDGQRIQ